MFTNVYPDLCHYTGLLSHKVLIKIWFFPPTGWQGINCSEDVDECALADACSKRGNCTNTPGSYHCTCNIGYIGRDCHFDNPCYHPQDYCLNGGLCDYAPPNENATASCNCTGGWLGPRCDQSVCMLTLILLCPPPPPQRSWRVVCWFYLVSSTILSGSISYLHTVSSNFRRCVTCHFYFFFKIKKFEILANSLHL